MNFTDQCRPMFLPVRLVCTAQCINTANTKISSLFYFVIETEYYDEDDKEDYLDLQEDYAYNFTPDKLHDSEEYTMYKEAKTDNRKLAINPLYIGVPVAGACVLLAIIIFAIYILKRQNRYLEDNYRNNLRQQGCVKPLTQDGKLKEPSCPTCRETCPYPDCERSSNGSETPIIDESIVLCEGAHCHNLPIGGFFSLTRDVQQIMLHENAKT